MNLINPHVSKWPRVSNSLDFLAYKNSLSSSVDEQKKCIDHDCFGHPEEYTCDPCLAAMGLNDDPTAHVAFGVVHESMKTCSDYPV